MTETVGVEEAHERRDSSSRGAGKIKVNYMDAVRHKLAIRYDCCLMNRDANVKFE